MATAAAVQEIKAWRALFSEIGVQEGSTQHERVTKLEGAGAREAQPLSAACSSASASLPATLLYTDNQAAQSLCMRRGVAHARTKHIDIRHHFVREAVAAGEVEVRWLPSREQLADVLTKGLDRQTHERLRQRIMAAEQNESENAPNSAASPAQ
jgi:hypothetical protein